MYLFSGYLSADQLLILWDLIVGYDSMEIVPGKMMLWYTLIHTSAPERIENGVYLHDHVSMYLHRMITMTLLTDCFAVLAVAILEFRAPNLFQANNRSDVEVSHTHQQNTYQHTLYLHSRRLYYLTSIFSVSCLSCRLPCSRETTPTHIQNHTPDSLVTHVHSQRHEQYLNKFFYHQQKLSKFVRISASKLYYSLV